MRLTQARVKELLHYNPDTGHLRWIVARGNRAAGDIAGTESSRYPMLSIDKKRYSSHQVMWLYITGKWPIEVDHENRNAHDNRWTNLREATRAQNCANTKDRKNASGYTGIWLQNGKYIARVTANKKKHALGAFVYLEEAVAMHAIFSSFYHGVFYKAVT